MELADELWEREDGLIWMLRVSWYSLIEIDRFINLFAGSWIVDEDDDDDERGWDNGNAYGSGGNGGYINRDEDVDGNAIELARDGILSVCMLSILSFGVLKMNKNIKKIFFFIWDFLIE